MPDKFVEPSLGKDAFHCPHCGVLAHHLWYSIYLIRSQTNNIELPRWQAAKCQHCRAVSLWLNADQIYPTTGVAPLPNDDLPPNILADYNEARDIASRSPRGAAALLRLAIQKLCKHVGASGTDINADIAKLVADGLPANVQKSLDSVRVIGNEAVHPGTLDLKDDAPTVAILFHLVNFITEKMISEPKQIDGIYGMIPEAKRKAIEERDKKGK
jgi:hypothetical protein